MASYRSVKNQCRATEKPRPPGPYVSESAVVVAWSVVTLVNVVDVPDVTAFATYSSPAFDGVNVSGPTGRPTIGTFSVPTSLVAYSTTLPLNVMTGLLTITVCPASVIVSVARERSMEDAVNFIIVTVPPLASGS